MWQLTGLSATLWSITTQAHSSCPAALWEDALRHRWGGQGWWMPRISGAVRREQRQSGLSGTVSQCTSRHDGKSRGNVLWGCVKNSRSRARGERQRSAAGLPHVPSVCTLPIKDATPRWVYITVPEHTHTKDRQMQTHTNAYLHEQALECIQYIQKQTLLNTHTHTHTHSAVSSLSLSVTPGEGVEELLAVPHWHSGLCVWVSVKPSNYRQPLHIHRWPDWLGIPRGISPKPLTHISNANTGRCRKMDASYFWKLR